MTEKATQLSRQDLFKQMAHDALMSVLVPIMPDEDTLDRLYQAVQVVNLEPLAKEFDRVMTADGTDWKKIRKVDSFLRSKDYMEVNGRYAVVQAELQDQVGLMLQALYSVVVPEEKRPKQEAPSEPAEEAVES
ncbi:hypothetical protein X832_gp157 [Pseudomonas phage PAK_P5]|uniref:Uncharacterized protein n=1 Tax=Pseudomonas phage PAK_P5 TaxID=1327964 RepID=V5JXX9_9CAUD|nr:hypothetical protein X832_gp157 [Pseudomonas phage PAK_P5]AGR89627.1 hypothetical protein PAK_P500160c [Pseudomonas phage PAK_P5]